MTLERLRIDMLLYGMAFFAVRRDGVYRVPPEDVYSFNRLIVKKESGRMNIFKKIPPNVRQAIYAIVTVVVAVLVAVGIIDKSILDSINDAVVAIGGIILAITTAMAAFNVNKPEDPNAY